MTKKIIDLIGDLEVKANRATIPNDLIELQKELLRLRKIIESYSLSDEMHISNIEYICQKAIDDMKHIVKTGMVDSDMAKTLDILHKNLRMARSDFNKKEVPSQETAESELLRIVNGKD